MIPCGQRNRRIQIQSYTSIIDDEGYQTQEWQTVYTVWASIRNFTAKEYFDSQTINPKASCSMNIRYIKNITTDMRVVYDGKTYNITSMNDKNECHEEIELLCEKVRD